MNSVGKSSNRVKRAFKSCDSSRRDGFIGSSTIGTNSLRRLRLTLFDFRDPVDGKLGPCIGDTTDMQIKRINANKKERSFILGDHCDLNGWIYYKKTPIMWLISTISNHEWWTSLVLCQGLSLFTHDNSGACSKKSIFYKNPLRFVSINVFWKLKMHDSVVESPECMEDWAWTM